MVMSLTGREILFFLTLMEFYTQLFQISNYMSFIIVSKKIWEILLTAGSISTLSFQEEKMNNVENHASLIFHWAQSTPTSAPEQKSEAAARTESMGIWIYISSWV